jgi:hypothetical protein
MAASSPLPVCTLAFLFLSITALEEEEEEEERDLIMESRHLPPHTSLRIP